MNVQLIIRVGDKSVSDDGTIAWENDIHRVGEVSFMDSPEHEVVDECLHQARVQLEQIFALLNERTQNGNDQ